MLLDIFDKMASSFFLKGDHYNQLFHLFNDICQPLCQICCILRDGMQEDLNKHQVRDRNE